MTEYSIKISEMLSCINEHPKIVEHLENQLKHYIVHSSFVEFTIPELQSYNLHVHFHMFSRSKKIDNRWYCRYYIYTQPGCLSFIRKDLDYSCFDEKIYYRILEIAKNESIMMLLNE
ncbi:hypothetical protein DDV96_14860 [Marixanthomonas spongiae]|uniref:Uncharacterized protein n=1 Tax=Marixanthomonas spongiae TaxID=2174845 RepID=A0A2U0HU44_9FLAO|nr:hypothetical protein DDV96_14860 [Marixanthomonas spongiae]